ncbi:MAG: ABC transporter ATP-binding protein [Bacillota bacterium]|nr:cobalt ABC transporter ATP-binding protein [Bacillota bacterium]REJ34888.1 MAG: cobalt ABC transporter ATP-binding protein [Bacillota bacterium]
MAVVEVDNLRYRYPRQTTLALDGISFTAEAGEFIGIVGPNLSGKSTLCHALIGLVPHFYKGAIGGRVVVAGLDVHATPVAEMSRRVGLVFQNPFTQITGAKLTVYEEVAFGLEYTGVPREEMVPRIEEALRLLGLWELRDRSPFALSGGQMQRLAIASVLAMKPQVLVLDEPTSQLDPSGTREVFEAVAALCRQGITVIMAEHKIELLAEHADRLLVLHQGRLVADGTPRDVLSRAVRGELENEPAPAPPVTEAAAALGWTMPEGGFPVTLDEAVAVGRAVMAGDSGADSR